MEFFHSIRQGAVLEMDTLLSMRVFAAVVETRSFAAAADRLAISRAMASKHIAQLEERLGTRLLHRTTRKIGLTESGISYFERCSQILQEIDEAETEAANLTIKPRGILRVTMPVSFAVRHVAPVIAKFLEIYPEVHVEASLSDRKTDLIEEGLDLALRIGRSLEPGLIAREIAKDRLVICAAPSYFENRRIPTSPKDLPDHDCFLYTYAAVGNEWKMTGPDGEHVVKVAGRLRANNGDFITQAVRDGIGLMCQPRFIVGDDLRAGRLIEVLPDYSFAPIGIYAVYPSRRHLSAKIRAFVEFITERFSSKTEW